MPIFYPINRRIFLFRMGNGSSQQISRKTSFRRQSSEVKEICRRIDEKECIFIAMQAEIDKAITENNRQAMKSLLCEIAAHIMELQQWKQVNMPSSERGRCQRVIYNFEICMAKLKSIHNSDTAVMKKNQVTGQENSKFYPNPDIVSDLMTFNSIDSRRSIPEHDDDQSELRTNSLYSNQPQINDDVFESVANELDVLKDQLQRPVEDITDYYKMNKGVFYLQVRLKDIEGPQGSTLNARKLELLKQLADFRNLLDRKSGELEEQADIIQEINTLEILVDSATEKELRGLEARALIFQEVVEKSLWDQRLKLELLTRIARILERTTYSVSPTASTTNSVEQIYVNLNSLQEEVNNSEALESIKSDAVLEQPPEDIYGNIEIIRQNVIPRVQRSSSNVSQRGTVYVNADVVSQNATANELSQSFQRHQELINKPPLPLPRNYEHKIVNDLPMHWQRLNEILDSEFISETDKMEVAEIRKHAEVAKNLFERKIKLIMQKCEECIEL